MSGGIGIGSAILGGLGIGAKVFGIGQQQEAIEARQQRLENQAEQVRIQNEQKAIQRAKKLEADMGANIAMQAARGGPVTGGSFQAVQTNNFQNFLHDQHIADENTEWTTDDINAHINSLQQAKRGSMYEGLFGIGINSMQLFNPNAFNAAQSGSGSLYSLSDSINTNGQALKPMSSGATLDFNPMRQMGDNFNLSNSWDLDDFNSEGI